MSRLFLVLLSLLTFLYHVSAFNILAIVSLPLRSHYMAFQSLFRELASRGHSITIMNNFPELKTVPNMNFIDMTRVNDSVSFMPPLEYYETFDSTYLPAYNFYRHFSSSAETTRNDCENFFTNEIVQANRGAKYDVIFVEQFIGDCGLAYAGAVFDAPIIGITSHVLLPLAYPRLGIPFDFNTDAFYFSNAGPYPSLYYKTEAFLFNFFYNNMGRWYMHRTIYEVFNRYLPNKLLDLERVAQDRMKMMFVYQHFSLTGARLLAPQVLEIGGIHIREPKPVPDAIEKFLSSAKHGAILISFGSNLKASTMSKAMQQQFLTAFKNIKQKVVWKIENATFSEENVFTDNWLPQLDILCHPNVVAFVSHGGMLSLSEAAHCGKPVLTIPFFGDQFHNAAVARATGIGLTLYFDRLNAENLANAIQELTLPKMQQNAKRISKLWHDRPLSVMDSAIYWTEYVARHGTAPAPLPSQRSSWFERLLLDVAAVIVAILFIFILTIYFVFKMFTSFLLMLVSRSSISTKKAKKE